MDELQDWQKNIIGLVNGWGKFLPAARAALEHGEEGVLFAMEVAARYVRDQTLITLAKQAKTID